MNTEVSMYGFILEGLDERAKKLYYYNNVLTGGQLVDAIERVAFFLWKNGIRKGDSVIICLPNVPQTAISFYAANAIGAIANIVHPRMNLRGLEKIIEKTNSKAIFALDRMLSPLAEMLTSHGLLTVSCSLHDYMKGGLRLIYSFVAKNINGAVRFFETLKERGSYERANDCLAPAVYLHSSGTTGEPKTVVLSSYAFNSLVKNVINATGEHYDYHPEDIMLMSLPAFHGYGLGICIHLSMKMFAFDMLPMFKAGATVREIKKRGIKYCTFTPSMLKKVYERRGLDSDKSSCLKLIFVGGDKANPDLIVKFSDLIKKHGGDVTVAEGYGLSEVASVATVNRRGNEKLGTQGKCTPGVELLVVDGEGKKCAFGENGRVMLRSQSMMNGYLNHESREYIFVDSEGEEWLDTGDVGSVDEDGFFTFKEREKRMLKVGGLNIFPSEVEEAVKAIDGVADACVLRIAYEGKSATELLLVLERNKEYTKAFEEKIKTRISTECMKYAVPRVIKVVKELKKNGLGKTDVRFYEEKIGE